MTNGDVELIDENNIHKLLIRPLKGFFCEGGGGVRWDVTGICAYEKVKIQSLYGR